MNDRDRLERFRELLRLYGWRRGWIPGSNGLAAALQIDAKNPERWERGERDIPDWVMEWLEDGLEWLRRPLADRTTRGVVLS